LIIEGVQHCLAQPFSLWRIPLANLNRGSTTFLETTIGQLYNRPRQSDDPIGAVYAMPTGFLQKELLVTPGAAFQNALEALDPPVTPLIRHVDPPVSKIAQFVQNVVSEVRWVLHAAVLAGKALSYKTAELKNAAKHGEQHVLLV